MDSFSRLISGKHISYMSGVALLDMSRTGINNPNGKKISYMM